MHSTPGKDRDGVRHLPADPGSPLSHVTSVLVPSCDAWEPKSVSSMSRRRKNRGGRPAKITQPGIQEKVLEALAFGATRRGACGWAGISEDSFARMLKKICGFAEQAKRAEHKAEARFVGFIARAAHAGTWQAAAWWLDRRLPQDYGRVERHQITSQNLNVPLPAEYVRAINRALGVTGALRPITRAEAPMLTSGNGNGKAVDVLPQD